MSKDKVLVDEAKRVPFQFWWNIGALIDKAKSEETIEALRWIMRKKELLEQYKSKH